MSGVAASQKQYRFAARRIDRLVGWIPQPPPSIVTQFLHHRAAAVGDVGNTTQVITANVIYLPTSTTFLYINGRSSIEIAAKIQLFFDSTNSLIVYYFFMKKSSLIFVLLL